MTDWLELRLTPPPPNLLITKYYPRGCADFQRFVSVPVDYTMVYKSADEQFWVNAILLQFFLRAAMSHSVLEVG